MELLLRTRQLIRSLIWLRASPGSGFASERLILVLRANSITMAQPSIICENHSAEVSSEIALSTLNSAESSRSLDATPAATAAPASDPASWHGRLQLEYWQRGVDTIVTSQVQAPLKVQRPFYPEGQTVCHSVMLHTAGGIVGGDRLSVEVKLQPQAQALITSAAATKVYGSNGKTAQQTLQVQVAENACLEWLPQETIVFDGAVYRQKTRIDLAVGALWLGWDIIRLGRSARGEQFLSGEWRSHLEVWQGDRLLWVDPQQVRGGSDMLTSPHGLGGCPVIASFAFVGRSIAPDWVQQAREVFVPLSQPGADVGVTRLMQGMLCRYRGSSTAEARRWFIRVWQLLRQQELKRSICIPRVWQM